MKPTPQIGDIWSWEGYSDRPLLLLEEEDGVEDNFLCLDLGDGSTYYMSFHHSIMDAWTRLA